MTNRGLLQLYDVGESPEGTVVHLTADHITEKKIEPLHLLLEARAKKVIGLETYSLRKM